MTLIKGIFDALMGIILMLMVVRAVLSWFRDGSGDLISTAYEVTFSLTEPLVLPVRIILERLNIGVGSPLDIAYMITWIIVSILDMVL